MTNYTIVAAMAENGVIGADNKLPWHIKEEFQHFKKVTMGKYLIMGRNTFDSLGRKILPGRKSIVITRTNAKEFEEADNFFVVNSISAVNDIVKDESEVMVIGGANIYQQFLPLASKMYLSVVAGNYQGDTYFPDFDKNLWQKEQEEKFSKFRVETWCKL